jgi:cytochrome c556
MKRYILAFLAIAVVGVMCGLARSQEDRAPKVFMRSKLEHSQKLLENLALEDFQAISKNSQALSLLSLAASWQVMQTPEYAQQSLEFRRAADAMTEAARNRNLDGAALAYVEMTMKCVNCHKYVRGVRLAAKDLPAERLAVGVSQ